MPRVHRAPRPFDVQRIAGRRPAEATSLFAQPLMHVVQVRRESWNELQGREREDQLLTLRTQIRRELGDAPELREQARVSIRDRAARWNDARGRRIHRARPLSAECEALRGSE